jgi:hemerythrin
MRFVEWNDKLSVKVSKIDEQHKKLLDLMNTLYDSMSIGAGMILMQNILTEMSDYTHYHFSTEEDYMLKFHYPEFIIHKAEHDYFKNKIIEFDTHFKLKKTNLASELLDFLKNWLIKHIKETDKKYGSFFNEHGLS